LQLRHGPMQDQLADQTVLPQIADDHEADGAVLPLGQLPGLPAKGPRLNEHSPPLLGADIYAYLSSSSEHIHWNHQQTRYPHAGTSGLWNKPSTSMWSYLPGEVWASTKDRGRAILGAGKEIGFAMADIGKDALFVRSYLIDRLVRGDQATGIELYRGSLSSLGQMMDAGELDPVSWRYLGMTGENVATAVSFGIYDQAKASVQLSRGTIGWDEWGDRIAVGGAFQLAGGATVRLSGLKTIQSSPARSVVALPQTATTTFGRVRATYQFLKSGQYFDEASGTLRSLNRQQIREIMSGMDFTHAVEIRVVPPGSRFVQYLRSGGQRGPWYAEPGTPAMRVGLYGHGRITASFETVYPTIMLRSKARPIFDHWTAHGVAVPTEGGAWQYFTFQGYKLRPI
jgi:hypothetical protein